jgi:hypothetical protein
MADSQIAEAVHRDLDGVSHTPNNANHSLTATQPRRAASPSPVRKCHEARWPHADTKLGAERNAWGSSYARRTERICWCATDVSDLQARNVPILIDG